MIVRLFLPGIQSIRSLCSGVVIINLIEIIILSILVGAPIVTTAVYDTTLYYLLIANVPTLFAAIFGFISCGLSVPNAISEAKYHDLNKKRRFIAAGAKIFLIVYLVFEALDLIGAIISLIWRIVLFVNCDNALASSACHSTINYNIAVSELSLMAILIIVSLIGFVLGLFVQRLIFNTQQAFIRTIRRSQSQVIDLNEFPPQQQQQGNYY
jgi:hypothetical protein